MWVVQLANEAFRPRDFEAAAVHESIDLAESIVRGGRRLGPMW